MLFQIIPDNAISKYKLISQGDPGVFSARTDRATRYHSACVHHSAYYHSLCISELNRSARCSQVESLTLDHLVFTPLRAFVSSCSISTSSCIAFCRDKAGAGGRDGDELGTPRDHGGRGGRVRVRLRLGQQGRRRHLQGPRLQVSAPSRRSEAGTAGAP